ncbi:hypothetical protein ATO13_22351 [Stappia sp. 22II-S9-Z10]|nr:hypothetical protein ATO13_22351 [Stappia sp. 22II-S9-Z10]
MSDTANVSAFTSTSTKLYWQQRAAEKTRKAVAELLEVAAADLNVTDDILAAISNVQQDMLAIERLFLLMQSEAERVAAEAAHDAGIDMLVEELGE